MFLISFNVVIFLNCRAPDPGHGIINGLMGMVQQVISAKVDLLNALTNKAQMITGALANKAEMLTGHFSDSTGNSRRSTDYTGSYPGYYQG